MLSHAFLIRIGESFTAILTCWILALF